MKTINTYDTNGMFYAVVNNNLIEIKVTKITYVQIQKSIRVYINYIHNGKESVLNHDYNEIVLYTSPQSYKSNAPINLEENHFYINGLLVDVLKNEDADAVTMHTSGFVSVNGQTLLKEFGVKTLTIEVDENGYGKNIGMTLVQDNIDVYRTREECDAYNKTSYTDINGEEKNYDKNGYMIELSTYSDEQKQAIKELQDAVDKIHGLGLNLMISDDGTHVLNTTQRISDSEWEDYDEDGCKTIFTSRLAEIKGVFRNYCENPILM